MKRMLAVVSLAALCACGPKKDSDPKAEAPPPPKVEQQQDENHVKVDKVSQFPLATAQRYETTPGISVTGVVSPDVSRTVPVVSLASGRVVAIYARLGDTVKKGQLLMRVQSADISSAFADYRKSISDETLARAQYERSKDLKEHGAIPSKDLEVAFDVPRESNDGRRSRA